MPDQIFLKNPTPENLARFAVERSGEFWFWPEGRRMAVATVFAEAAGRVVGCASEAGLPGGARVIVNVWVDPDFRGHKLGHRLIRDLLEKSPAERVFLACRRELAGYYGGIGFAPAEPPSELAAMLGPGDRAFLLFTKNQPAPAAITPAAR